MSQEKLKTIVEPENALYVFDFDDTLISDKASVYVVNEKGRRKALTVQEFHKYKLLEGEHMDFSEFNEVTDPTPHEDMMELLKSHLDKAVILTARSRVGPIRNYLSGIGIVVPEVVAVGSRFDDGKASQLINAGRKRDWISQEIEMRSYEYVEFWDDNEHNIGHVLTLKEKHPDVKIVCHLVRHLSCRRQEPCMS